MFTKVLIISAVAALACAIEYPAGMHPAICPNYPICDAEVLARHTLDGTPIPEWELPFHAPYAYMRLLPYVLRAEDIALRYPAGVDPAVVDPAVCPNYPYCT